MTAEELVVEALHTPQESLATVPPPPPDLALEQDILGRFVVAIRGCGVVGEDATAATVFLQIVSRLLDEPVSGVVKGASSSGKSYTVQSVVKFFPKGSVIELTGMSERALVFSDQDYRHRTIVVYEAVALRERAERQSGNLTAYFVRSLISEGVIRYPMSVKDKDGNWTTKMFEKQGPTNVILTTTALHLHNENETRLLSLSTNDTPSQTRRVLIQIADRAESSVDLHPWHELQRWVEAAEHRVQVPFARYLAENVPPVAIRLRRDFGSVLSLIRAHAVLHQMNRERDPDGRIIADERDYLAVRELILPVVSQGIGATVSPTIRETVAAVADLHPDHEAGAPAATVAQELKLDKSAARRRLIAASDAGYVVNLEERRGRPGRYVLGEHLPEDVEVLPMLPPHHRTTGETAGRTGGGTVASDSEGVETTTAEDRPCPECGAVSSPGHAMSCLTASGSGTERRPPVRETAAQKAERLLVSGRVVIVRADGRHIRALVRGDTEGFHTVEHGGGRWTCDCSHAPYGSCSHRRAVMLATAPVQPAIFSHDLMIGASS